jgi:hypothetical protein
MGPIMPQLLVMRCVVRSRLFPEWKNHRQRRIIFRCRWEKGPKTNS